MHYLKKLGFICFFILMIGCASNTQHDSPSLVQKLFFESVIAVFDSFSQIGFTKYHLYGSDAVNRYIAHDGSDQVDIDFRIVNYEYNFNYIVAVRQIGRAYNCDDGSIPIELLDKYEYWVIELSTDQLHGPMNYDVFLAMTKDNLWLKKLDLGSLESIREENIKKGYKEIKLRENCINPKLITLTSVE